MSCTARVTELTERLCLDLTDTLTGDIKLLTDLFKRSRSAVVKTESQLYNVLLAGSQGVKLALDDLAEDGLGGGVGGGGEIGRAHV